VRDERRTQRNTLQKKEKSLQRKKRLQKDSGPKKKKRNWGEKRLGGEEMACRRTKRRIGRF